MTIETQQFPLLLDGGPPGSLLDGSIVIAHENSIGAQFHVIAYGRVAYIRDVRDFNAKAPYGEGKTRLVSSAAYRVTVPAVQGADESWQPGRAEYVPKEDAEAGAK